MITHQIDVLIPQLKSSFEKSFKSRIVCLIHHGSSLYKDINNEPSDIDLELVLSRYEKNDYLLIQKILKRFGVNVECQLRYLWELTNAQGLISNTSYKIFMYFAYSNGICLLGENIYKNLIKKLTDEEIKDSLLISAQIEFKNIRKEYFSKSRARVVNKHIKVFLLDVFMYLGTLDYRNLGKKSFFKKRKTIYLDEVKIAFSKWMSAADYKIFQEFIDDCGKNRINEEMFLLVNKISNNLFKK